MHLRVGERPCAGETPCRRNAMSAKVVSAKRRVGEPPCRRKAVSAKAVSAKGCGERRVGETSSYGMKHRIPVHVGFDCRVDAMN